MYTFLVSHLCVIFRGWTISTYVPVYDISKSNAKEYWCGVDYDSDA